MADLAYELNFAAAAAGPGRLRRGDRPTRPAALRRRRARPDQPHRVDLARRQRPGRPQRHLRRAGRGLPRAGQRPGRRRRRPAADRDDLRHPQRQGGDLRPRDAVRGARSPLAGDDLRHDHRRLRPHPVRPGHRGVLELGAPRPPAADRPQLRARAPRRCGPTSPSCPGSPTASSPATPTPACPTPSASTTRPRTRRPRCSGSSPTSGLVNLLGGCCGTTAEHIAGDRRRAPRASRRATVPEIAARVRLSGLEPLTITDDSLFVNVGERTNITGSAKFRNLIRDGDYNAALSVAPPAGRERRAGHRRQHGRRHDRRRRRDGPLRQADRQRARHQPGAADGRLLEVRGDRGRPALRAGQADRQLDLDEGGRGEVPRAGPPVPQVRRRRRRDGLRRGRAGRQPRAPQADLRARLPDPGRRGRLPGRGHHLRPQHLRGRHRHRGARQLRRRLHRGHPLDQAEPARRAGLRRRLQRRRSPSAATTRCARRSTPSSCIHAIAAGMDMGIVNAGALVVYDQVDPELRERIEDVILNRRPDATERLLEIAERVRRGRRVRARSPTRSGASCRSTSGSPTPWSRASTTTPRPTPRSCAP